MTYTVVDVDATTREGRTAMRAIVRELADDHAHDPYGSGMCALGAIVDTLWASGEGVPSAIVSPGANLMGSEEAEPILDGIDTGELTTADVRYFMFVLSRYIDVVRLAGHQH